MTFRLDPQIAASLSALLPPDFVPPPVGDISARRAGGEALIDATNGALPRASGVVTSDHTTTSADGAEVPMRWYRPEVGGTSLGPAVVYFHGGGYILGRIDQFDRPITRYVAASGVPILLVEYRRAPEHPHPAPVEDGYAALTWLRDNAADLSVDPQRIAVMGDSAGAGLAASLAILARDPKGPPISAQILIMPMLDDRNRTPDAELAPMAAWSYADNITAWDALLGQRAEDEVPTTAAPARLQDATGLPPAYIEVGQIDIFRDEDLLYALTLSRAGVPVEFHLWPGAILEFDAVAPDSDLARRAIGDRVRVLRDL